MGIKRMIAKILYTLGTTLAIYKLIEYISFVWTTKVAELTISMYVASGLSVLGIFGLVVLWFILVAS